MKALWYIGIVLQLIGLASGPVALSVGILAGNLGQEWMIFIPGVAVFFFGTWLRNATSGG